MEELRGAAEAGQPGAAPPSAPEPALWSSQAARFHELIMQRSGSKTLAVQGGVLQDIVATHLALALSRDRARDDELANFRRNVRSYERLVALVEERDGPGAEQHWRAHMEAAGQRLLREDLQSRSVVDLFS
ncbi:MAG TPA: FCD domain-containing protein [Streptosporangiaceae bacterium]|nr:FCD domain-containing protein [Streptosporangiaceae bacterium]